MKPDNGEKDLGIDYIMKKKGYYLKGNPKAIGIIQDNILEVTSKMSIIKRSRERLFNTKKFLNNGAFLFFFNFVFLLVF